MASPPGFNQPVRESFMLEQRSEGSSSSAASVSAYSHSYHDSSNDDDEEEFPRLDCGYLGDPNFGTASAASLTASDYMAERARRTVVGRVLYALGLGGSFSSGSSGHTYEYDYFSGTGNSLPDGLLKQKRSGRERRRSRRSKVGTLIRRALLAIPITSLLLLGILHVLQIFYGSAPPFWEEEGYDENFMPDWGKPGAHGDGMAKYPTDATRDIIPIPCHSHNDYWRRIPVFDAIHWGCTSIEADVWLFDDDLFVGHNTAALTHNRTFRSLYVDPLMNLLDQMNPQTEFSNTTHHGVFDEDPSQTLVLLVDLKTSGRETYRYLHSQLSEMRERGYLSYWDGERFHSRAITIVGTGNTPFDSIIASTSYRDIFFDAPLEKFWEEPEPQPSPDAQVAGPAHVATQRRSLVVNGESADLSSAATTHLEPYDTSNSYYASTSFTASIGFVWRGRLSAHQLHLLRGQIQGAKRRGLRARYWDTPSWPRSLRNHVWHVLMREGADVLNVDDLKGAAVENWRAKAHQSW